MDTFDAYGRGIQELLNRLGKEHPRYADALVLQTRLTENIGQSRKFGDTQERRSDRAQIVDALNRLALEAVGQSFNELCDLAQDEPVLAVPTVSSPELSAVWQQRLRNLADNTAQDLALLKEYEDALRYEDDLRRRARYRRETEQLRESLARYQKEYDELRAQVIGEPPAEMQDVVTRLQQMDTKLDTLLTGQRTIRPVVPLGISLPMRDLPPHLTLPSGYRYLGQLDGLATDYFYREQDGHVALWFPAMPGISKPFLIDKYAITAQQFCDCLNDLLRREVVRIDHHPTNSVQCCVDSQGRFLAFDALDRWRHGPTSREPWLHTAAPWGMTCQDGVWQPVSGSELLPATLVTWWGARLYSLWAHQQPIDLTNDEVAYLPTVQQWQTAALWDPLLRQRRRYPWGDTWQREKVNYAGHWAGCEVREADWERLWATQADTYRQTRPLPVADLNESRSPIGCVQMIGNVWEWCADNPTVGRSTSKVVKGGACLSPQEHCSPDWHVAWRPEQGNEYIGFRCCFPLMG